MKISKIDSLIERSKHIYVKWYFLKDKVQYSTILVPYFLWMSGERLKLEESVLCML